MAAVAPASVPVFALYGERGELPDVLHVETIAARSVLHGWNIRPHRHARMHQMLLVAAGTATAALGDRVATVAGPAAIAVPPRAVHGFRFTPGTQGFVVTVPAEVVGTVVAACPTLAGAAVVAADAALAALFAEMAEKFDRSGPTRAATLAALATLILARIAEAAGPAATPGPALVRRFEALVDAEFRARRRVADYAAALRVSPTHLTRVCRAATGLTAGAIVEARVAMEARRLLAYTSFPVGRIAADLGFDDFGYFTRTFVRATGLTPTAFRARVAEGAAPPKP